MQILDLGLVEYAETLIKMRDFTRLRDDSVPDEVWLLEHPAVYTLGQAGDIKHVLAPKDIPVVQSCRGGQVTYHGPGQLVIYPLLDLARRKQNLKWLITTLEDLVLTVLAQLKITGGARQPGAPGIYVEGRKIAQLGLRVSRGKSFHGLAVNVNMDIEPFTRINPCGYTNLSVCQLSDWVNISVENAKLLFTTAIKERF